jgi:hypothetical protein
MSKYRIIFERNHPSNAHMSQIDTVYDYEHNPDGYACINVDDEVLCYLKLRHITWLHKFAPGDEMLPIMPTYVCHYE